MSTLPIARPVSLLFISLVAGCIIAPSDGSNNNNNVGANGFGRPTLELTINGAHFGPSAPDTGSAAYLVTSHDSTTGRPSGSTFRVSASSASSGASCALTAQRQGDDVAPFTIAGYQLNANSLGATPDGVASPIGGESVSVPQGAWQCSGSSCNGGALVIIGMDASHVEGYVGGQFQNTAGAASAQVVCSFYLPFGSYVP